MADTLAAAKADLAPKGDEAFQSVLDSAMADPEIAAIAAEPVSAEVPAAEPAAAVSGIVVEQPAPDIVVEDIPAAAEPASVPTAEPGAPPVAAAPDPLADTAPLDYGQGKSFDGVLLDKANGGAIILPDKIDAVRARLAEGDTFREQADQLAARVQHFDSLSYKTTGFDGEPAREFKGVDAFVRAQADAAALAKATLVLMEQIEASFPGEQFAQARKDLYDKMQFEVRKTVFDTSTAIRGRVQAAQQTFTAQAGLPSEGEWFAKAIGQFKAAFPALTPADITAGEQFFAKRPEMLYRTATAQDAATYGLRVGMRFADPGAMTDWFSERAALRAEQATQASARATAASAAEKHNAAMEKGRQTGAPRPGSARRAPATPAATIPEKVSRKQAWDANLADTLQEMGIDG